MREIFLSASVPVKGRGNFFDDANPYLIQVAVREFVLAVLGRRKIIYGGHPAITPMIWAVCEGLGISYAENVVLYQSHFFSEMYPDENAHFKNVVYTNAVADNRDQSLLYMRQQMLSRPNIVAGVFIGGMEGIAEEYELLKQYHQDATIVAASAAGGAARQLVERLNINNPDEMDTLDFTRLFYHNLAIEPTESRKRVNLVID